MTLRLYYEDAYLTEFDAHVVRTVSRGSGMLGVILDRTGFYPTSGGQPCDQGLLDSQRVVDVIEDDHDIIHCVSGHLAGPTVHGRINWQRRFDHMQQHTGQHILSQAFIKILNAETVGFHLGADCSTIDIDRAPLQMSEAEEVEQLSNQIVFADAPILTRLVQPEELVAFHLRKAPRVDTDIRIVEIQGFDITPCGGTHCSRTGEVGLIAVRRWERRGGETRVEFLCGWRAVRDYGWKTAALNQMALNFSVKDRELPAAVARLVEEASDMRREVSRLQEKLLASEADRLLSTAVPWNDIQVIVAALPERDPQQARRLAALLAEHARTIALLGTGVECAYLVFARSSDLCMDMSSLLKDICQAQGGNGGGQSSIAQGGGFSGERVQEALQAALRVLTTGKEE